MVDDDTASQHFGSQHPTARRPVASGPRQSTPGRAVAVIGVLMAGIFAYQMLEQMLAPALPLIQQQLGTSTAAIAWVLTGVLLSGAVATPLIGRLADIRDKRHVLLATLAVVALGTLISAVAPSLVVLVVGQLLQGAGLGIVPLAIGIIRDTQPPGRAKSGNGLIIGTAGPAFIVGTLIAGPIVAHLFYTWLFWIPLIVLVLALAVAWWFVPSCPPETCAGRIDLAGATLLGVALAVLLAGLTLAPDSGWASAGFLVPLAVALVLLAAFVVVELRVPEPLVDLHLLAGRTVLLVCLISFAIGFASFAVLLILPKIVELPAATGYGLGSTVTFAGLLFVPLGAAAAVLGPLTGRLERLMGSRAVMVLAMAAVAASCLVLFAGREPWALAVASLLTGIGQGLGLTAVMNIVVASVPAQRVGAVSGIAFVLKSVGGTFGAQLGASILAADVIPGTTAPTWGALGAAFWLSAAVGIVATLLSFGLPRRVARVPGSTRATGEAA